MAEEKRVYTVANAHLDTVWRWNLATTIREHLPDTVGKNFYLIQKIPNYSFNFEGAYRYKLIKEYYPDFFEQIQDYVRYGQWHISGSSYENGDVNIPSPEAIFRNILLGNNFFKENFNKTSKDLFLPDCFGFGLALPAIAKHSNLLGLTTQKLSWGSAYGVPFNLGKWIGVDGSQIYAALNPGNYTNELNQIRNDKSVLEQMSDAQKMGCIPWLQILHGDGDRGGSPSESSASEVSKAIDLNQKSKIKVISAGSDQIFRDVNDLPKEAQSKLPEFHNELLLTAHGTGCYTSRAIGKRLNRRCENLADKCERSCVAADFIADYIYPKSSIKTAWGRVVTHQFHDDITGTSTMEVCNNSWNDYFKSINNFQNEYTASVDAIAPHLDTTWVEGIAVIVNNSVAADRTDAVIASIHMNENSPYVNVFNSNGEQVRSQIVSKRGKSFEIIFEASVQSLGYAVYDVRPSGTKCNLPTSLKITEHTLENSKYAIVFNKNGDIGSIIDKSLKKQILSAPIKLALLKDTGSLIYPSWEINYNDITSEPVAFANTPTFEIVHQGAAKVTLKVSRTANGSTFSQLVSLTENGQFITVENQVNWQCRKTMLKVQFPFSSCNEYATYDLGLGTIQRPTNSQDLYEVPAQKWADISNDDKEFGVSVFSDGLTGWDKPNSNTLRLTCIHTPFAPFTKDARQDLQDLGDNRFGFAVFSHSGDYTDSTQIQSELYANQMTAFQFTGKNKGELGANWSFGKISNAGILVRAIKIAENSDKIIIRVNETNGQTHKAVSIKLANKIISAQEVFASEEYIDDATVEEGNLVFDIKPFEIKSFAITLKKHSKKGKAEKQIPLELEYNVDVITNDFNRRLTIMAASGVSLPQELFPEEIKFKGIMFQLGKNQERYNALIPRGQKILLPNDINKLYILAASVHGDKELTFFADSKPRKITIHDFFEPIGQWEMFALRQPAKIKTDANLAFEFTHTHSPDDDNFGESGQFFMYEIDVNRAKELTLPEDNYVVILGMTGINKAYDTVLATEINDKVSETQLISNPKFVDKVIDKIDVQSIIMDGNAITQKGKKLLFDNPLSKQIKKITKK